MTSVQCLDIKNSKSRHQNKAIRLTTSNSNVATIVTTIEKIGKFSDNTRLQCCDISHDIKEATRATILGFLKSLFFATFSRPNEKILEGVKRTWEEEEKCSRASPLTLTGITKGLKNEGKETKVETKEEEGDDRGSEQARFESPIQERQERQKSLSPIYNLYPEVKETHQEPVENSGQ